MIGTRTIAGAIDSGARKLSAAGIAQPRFEARLLLDYVLGLPPERVLAERARALGREEAERFEALTARRASREPIAQILGRREFWSLPFKVTPDTLIPRPETEVLVEAALDLIPDRQAPLRILDLGTGTGCLLLALLSELLHAEGIGIDASQAACGVARENAASLGLVARARFLPGDWDKEIWDAAALGGSFEFVVSNPPYVPDGEIDGLQPEVVRFEPRLALAGGFDGLACYRALAPLLPRLLAPGGYALLELGQGQAEAVSRVMAKAGLIERFRCLDLAGTERCLVFAADDP